MRAEAGDQAAAAVEEGRIKAEEAGSAEERLERERFEQERLERESLKKRKVDKEPVLSEIDVEIDGPVEVVIVDSLKGFAI